MQFISFETEARQIIENLCGDTPKLIKTFKNMGFDVTIARRGIVRNFILRRIENGKPSKEKTTIKFI